MIKFLSHLSNKIFLPMKKLEPLISRDLKHHFHPCSQMKDMENYPPFEVKKAKGSILYTSQGEIIDAISSWWCKSLGHGYDSISQAISEQLQSFEHVITANSTNTKIVELSEKLAKITKLQHAFFASDGSSAVEIALKLAIFAQKIKGNPERNEFLALKNGYHGETFATLSVSDLGLYKEPFSQLSLRTHFIKPHYINNANEPAFNDFQDFALVEQELEKIKHKICAFIFEPIVQGAGGMLCYSQDFLHKLSQWAKKNNIYLIADEIMTGFGRTGKWLASQYANIQPDIVCLSKGLTSGTIPFSAVMLDKAIYDLFYDDFKSGKSFLHSHTFSGNALGVSAALATINAMQELDINTKALELGKYMDECFTEIGNLTNKVTNIRSIGAVVAAELVPCKHERISLEFHQKALKNGALLRPLGNTLYWLPPLNTDFNTIAKLCEITLNSIKELYK